MKKNSNYILEKFHITKDSKLDMSPGLKSVLDHFNFDHLYEIDRNRLEHEPFITKEEGEEIIKQIDKFLIDNNADYAAFKFFCPRGMHFSDPKIEKDFRKNTSDYTYVDKLNVAKDTKTIFKGRAGLKIKCSSEYRQLAIYGPYGGAKLCCLENPYKKL